MANLTHHSTTINGFDMHYVQAGKGQPLVLIHGWPETWYTWRHVIPELAKHFKVIAPDLRGFGDSGVLPRGYDKKTLANDVHQLLSYLGVNDCYVVGHDWGGVVALNLAFEHREMVKKLAILEVAIPDKSYEQLPLISRRGSIWHFAFQMIADLPETLTKGREREYIEWFNRWGSANKNKPALSEEAVNEYVRCYSRPGSMKAGFDLYRTVFEDIDRHELYKEKKLDIPVLALGGDHNFSMYVSVSVQQFAHQVQGGIIENCGHWMAEEQPEKLLAQLLPFLTA